MDMEVFVLTFLVLALICNGVQGFLSIIFPDKGNTLKSVAYFLTSTFLALAIGAFFRIFLDS